MDTNAQVVLVLKLTLNIAPIALYFVILGLVNSQSRPHLISSRNDWLALIIVFCPIVLFPALWLASGGYYYAGLIALAVTVLAIYLSLPRAGGWVVYNCSKNGLHRSLIKALQLAGLDYEILSSTLIRLREQNCDLQLSSLPLLKNTTITVVSQCRQEELTARIEDNLRRQLDKIENPINPSGPALLVTGTSMLILPLLMMVRHIDAFVRVVCDLLAV